MSWSPPEGVTRRLNRLERHPGNPVLVGDRPWERWLISPNGRAVLFDRETGEFKMWYMASHMEEGAPGGFRYKVAYAVSQGRRRLEQAESGSSGLGGFAVTTILFPGASTG